MSVFTETSNTGCSGESLRLGMRTSYIPVVVANP